MPMAFFRWKIRNDAVSPIGVIGSTTRFELFRRLSSAPMVSILSRSALLARRTRVGLAAVGIEDRDRSPRRRFRGGSSSSLAEARPRWISRHLLAVRQAERHRHQRAHS